MDANEDGNEDDDVLIVGEKQEALSFNMKELERQLAKKGSDTRAWVGRGTPPTRGEMMQWLLSVDEVELAHHHRVAGYGLSRPSSSLDSRRREEERETGRQVTDESKGKGKGKGKSSRREEDAEDRHVRRQREGRGE